MGLSSSQHKDGLNFVIIQHAESLTRQQSAVNGFGRTGHNVAGGLFQQCGAHIAAQIAIGNHARQTPPRVATPIQPNPFSDMVTIAADIFVSSETSEASP